MSCVSKLMSGLSIPKFMPLREPDFKTLDEDPIRRCNLKGVGDNDTEDNGVLYYYDEPLLFAAKIENKLVLVTLIDQDYANDGMKDNRVIGAKGWDQYLAIEISEELLRDVAESRVPLRAAYNQETVETWFIHKNWINLDIKHIVGDWDPRNWYSVFRIWRNVPVLDKWKPKAGAYLNPDKKGD